MPVLSADLQTYSDGNPTPHFVSLCNAGGPFSERPCFTEELKDGHRSRSGRVLASGPEDIETVLLANCRGTLKDGTGHGSWFFITSLPISRIPHKATWYLQGISKICLAWIVEAESPPRPDCMDHPAYNDYKRRTPGPREYHNQHNTPSSSHLHLCQDGWPRQKCCFVQYCRDRPRDTRLLRTIAGLPVPSSTAVLRSNTVLVT
jgi:hypothetical protein